MTKNIIKNNILEMCTGDYYFPEGPPIYSKCTTPCVHQAGGWGASWCSTKDGNWGAPCVSCPGNCKKIFRILPF